MGTVSEPTYAHTAGAPDRKLAAAAREGVTVVQVDEDPEMARLHNVLNRSSIVVDAVLGTGRSRPIEGGLEAILRVLAEARAHRPDMRLFAVDVPTGLDADSGEADPACVAARTTRSRLDSTKQGCSPRLAPMSQAR